MIVAVLAICMFSDPTCAQPVARYQVQVERKTCSLPPVRFKRGEAEGTLRILCR